MVTYTVLEGVLASVGGILLGISTSIHWLYKRRLTGASGIMENLFSKAPAAKPWHVAWVVGCYHAAFIYITATGGLTLMELPYYFFLIAGWFVGFGARLGNGCTSGHGVCGLARLNFRSYVAVGTFMCTAVGTANLTHYSQAYSFNSASSDMSASSWLSSSPYLGWPIFVIGALAVLTEMWDVFYPAAGKSDGDSKDAIGKFKELLILYFCGGLFGVGLSLGGMINNGIVINFLTFNDDWNPSLMFVLGFSVMVFGAVYWYKYFSEAAGNTSEAATTPSAIAAGSNEGLIEQEPVPPVAPEKTDSTPGKVDCKLVLGAACFGVGWGLAGICPAPAVTILCTPLSATFFFPTLYLGMKCVPLLLSVVEPEKGSAEGDHLLPVSEKSEKAAA